VHCSNDLVWLSSLWISADRNVLELEGEMTAQC
jgi:hypothetical protein